MFMLVSKVYKCINKIYCIIKGLIILKYIFIYGFLRFYECLVRIYKKGRSKGYIYLRYRLGVIC